MKALCIPVLLGAAMLSLCLWVGARTDRHVRDWTALLTQADEAALLGQWELARERLLQAREHWDRQQPFLRTVMSHSDLDSAEDGFSGALAACRMEDPAQTHILLCQLTGRLAALADIQRVSLANIF